VFFLASCFGESTGPELRPARLIILPSFANPHAARVVDFDRVRVTLRRPGQTPPAFHFDTVISFPAGADTLRLELAVPITGTTESFALYLAMYNTTLADTVFTSGPDPITATTNVLNLATAEPVLTYVGVGSNAAGVRFVNPQAAAFFGATVTLVAEAFDSGGAAIPGTPIVYVLANPADSLRARIPDRDVGQVIAGQQRGPVGLRAELLTNQFATHTLAVQPVPSAIRVQAGNNQTGAVGSTLGQAVVARVLAADSLGVQGVIVTFAVTAGGGTVSATTDTSDANGDASTVWTLGGSLVAQTLTASAAGVTGSTPFGATATPGAAVRLSFLQEPTNANELAVIAPPVTVRALDQFGNPVTTFTGTVAVAIGTNPGGGALGGTLSRTATAGVATFNDLTVSVAGTGYTLVATSGTLSAATSATFNVIATTPVALQFQMQPSGVQAGAVITPAVQVRLVTSSGATATTATNAVTIAIGTNPAGGSLSGTLTVNAIAGIATFNDLTIDNIGTGYTLAATATGLTGATSSAFDVLAPPNQVSWINPAGGSWSVGANWSTGSPPTAGDSVLIKLAGTYTVTLDQNVTIAHLVVGGPSGTQTVDVNGFGLTVTGSGTLLPASRLLMTSGSVTGAGLMQSSGQVIFQGGTFTGGGTLRVLAGGTLPMGGTANRFLTGYNLEVAGTATYNATAGFFQLNNGAQLRVLSGGTFDLQGDRSIQWGSGGVPLIHVQSGGTFTRSAGTGTFNLSSPLQNDGVATFATGITNYAAFGQAVTGSGQFNVPAGAILDFANVNLTLSAASSIAGAGEVHFSAATVTSSGAYNVTGTTRIQGGTFVYDNAAGGATANLVLSSGTRAGTGLLQVTGSMVWTGGTLSGTGTTRIPAGVTLAASGAAVHDFSQRHVLEIGGTFNYAATGGFRAGDSAIVRILGGATLDLQAPGTLSWTFGAIPPRIENAGTLRYSGTGGTYVIDGVLDNTGTLQVQTDTVRLTRGSTVGGTLNLVGANAKVVFDGLTATLQNGTALTGAGTPELRSGTLTLVNAAAAVSWARFRQTGGILSHAGTLTVTGTLDWVAGAMQGTGTTRVPTLGTLTASGAAVHDLHVRHVLEVGGTLNYTGTGGFRGGDSAVVRILGGATLDFQVPGTLSWMFGAIPPRIENAGTLRYSGTGGTYVIDGVLDNTGTLQVQTDTVRLTRGSTVGGTMNLVGANTKVVFDGLTTTLQNGTVLTGAGTPELRGGTLTLVNAAAAVSWARLRQTGGALNHAGTLTVTGTFDWVAGALQGTGTTRVPTLGTLTASGIAVHDVNTRHVLEIGGTLNYTGTGGFRGGDSAIVRILAGGTLDLQVPGTLSWAFGAIPPRIENAGTLRYSGTGGTYTIDGVLDNTGTLQVQTDTVRLTRGSSLAGTLNLPGTGKLVLEFQTNTLRSGFTMTGAGPGVLEQRSGTMALDLPTTTVALPRFTLSGGSVQHRGTLNLTGVSTWTAGEFTDSGLTRVPGGGTMTASGAAVHDFRQKHTLEIGGTVTYSATGGFRGGDSSIVRIVAGGLLDLQQPGALSFAFGSQRTRVEIQPTGTLRRSGAVGAFVIDAPINKLGTIDITAGTLRPSAGSVTNFTGAVTGAGTLDLGGGTFTLTGTTTVAGPLVVSAGQLDVGGRTLTLSNGFSTTNTGTLRMASAADSVDVTGIATSFGGGSTAGLLTDGVLAVRGNLSQVGVGSSFSASGAHRVRLLGGLGQTVSFASPATNPIPRLLIDKTAGTVQIASDLRASFFRIGTATNVVGVTSERLLTDTISGTALSSMTLRAIEITSVFSDTGSFSPDTTVFSGSNQVIPFNAGAGPAHAYKSIRISQSIGSATFAANTTLPNDLVLNSGGFNLSGRKITVTGNFRTEQSGSLVMTNAADSLLVTGNASFGGGISNNLTAGLITVGGNFTQTVNSQAYAPSGTHHLTLNGTGTQTISFANPGAALSRFDVVEIAGSGASRNIVLQTNVAVNDSLIMQSGGFIGADLVGAGTTQRLTVAGVIRVASGTTSPRLAPPVLEMSVTPNVDPIGIVGKGVEADTIVFLGSLATMPINSGLHYNHVRVSTTGALAIASDTITGDLDIAAGTASFTGGTFQIGGRLRTRATGVLRMQGVATAPIVVVTDSAIFAGASTAGVLNDGTLRLLGHFVQAGGNTAAFQASAAHVTLFANATRRNITMTNAGTGATNSRFGQLFLDRLVGGVSQAVSVGLQTSIQAGMIRDTGNLAAQADSILGATGLTVTADSASANNLVFDRAPLTLSSGSAAVVFNNVRFQNMDPTTTFLTMFRNVSIQATMNNINFASVHTSGRYFAANTVGVGGPGIFTFVTSLPVSFTSAALDYSRTGATLPTVNWNGVTNP